MKYILSFILGAFLSFSIGMYLHTAELRKKNIDMVKGLELAYYIGCMDVYVAPKNVRSAYAVCKGKADKQFKHLRKIWDIE